MSISENRREHADVEKRFLEHGGAADDKNMQGIDIDDPNFDPTLSMIQEESPYAEVRSAVANTDDPTMPASTLRAWVVRLIWAVLLPGVNQFFSFRYPTVFFPPTVAVLITLPICKAWARYMPNISILGIPLKALNPGPFNIKEHVIISVMADIGADSAYGHPTFAYQWMLVMSTELIGFSMAGICRRFLVTPASMIWPENLWVAAIINTLHFNETTGSQGYDGISRQRIFTYVFIGSIFYTFLPSYLFTALSSFSWVCWIAPQNYQAYSPLFISASFAITYGLGIASLTATVTHILLYYHKHIRIYARRSLSVQPDVHAQLMSVYKEVPDWWYFIIFLLMFVFGVVVIEAWKTGLPVWAFVLALTIAFVFIVPIGIIDAATNIRIGLNMITELIIGYALPGRPIAMMMFKTWGYITMRRGLEFISNLKLGHYMKVPPRSMFFCQIVATVVAGTVQLGVQAWMFSNVEDLCSPDQKDGFTCPHFDVFGTESIIWGVIGPHRMFSHGQLYCGLSFFLVGTLAPLFQWFIHKKFNVRSLKYLHFPVIFFSVSSMPPATPINFVPWVLVCYIFSYRIRRRHFHWWSKYNYILSTGLDVGYAVGAIVIFFTLQYPKNGAIGLKSIQSWWGNVVYTKTADFAGVAYKMIPDGETFGPSSW